MFLHKSTYTNDLAKELKENPNLPIEKILSNSELMISIRNELPELISYFENDGGVHLQELFDIALTNKLNTNKIDFRYNRNASNILSCPSRIFQKNAVNNPITIKSLNNFMKNSNFFRDTSFSGHFQRIIQSFQYFTNGSFIEQFSGLSDFLLHNIDLLSYRQLLVCLITDFSDNLKDKNILIKIAKIANSTDNHFNISAVFTLSDIMHDRPNFPFLYRKDIIENLVEKAASIKDDKGNILFFEIFNTLRLITNNYNKINQTMNKFNSSINLSTSNSDSISDSSNKAEDDQEKNWVSELLSKYVKEFSFEVGKPKERSYCAFPFFSDYLFSNYSPNTKKMDKNATNFYLDQMVNPFFTRNPPTQFTLSFISGVEQMNEESLLSFIETNNILRRIMDSNIKMPYESLVGATSGHIFQLAMTIFNRKLDPSRYNLKRLDDKSIIGIASHEWSLFLATEILIRSDMIKECLTKVNENLEYSECSDIGDNS